MAYRPSLPNAVRRFRGAWPLLLCGAAALALAGCHEDVIQEYTAPTDAALAVPENPHRTVVAFLDHGGQLWSFKITGPQDVVEKHHGEFLAFLKGVRFDAQSGALGWSELPDGWRKVRWWWHPRSQDQMRYATLLVGKENPAPECVVSAIGMPPSPAARDMFFAMNVNRWRGQVGLKTVAEDDALELTRDVPVGDTTGRLLDAVGPGKPPRLAQAGGSGMGPPRRKAAGKNPALDDVQPFPLEGVDAKLVDLTGTNNQGRPDRMVIIVADPGQGTWVFKLWGPPGLVGSQKAAFEQFVRSVKFNAASPSDLDFTVPPGWEKGRDVQYAKCSFVVSDASGSAVITATRMPTFDLAFNLARWRSQVHLNPTGAGGATDGR